MLVVVVGGAHAAIELVAHVQQQANAVQHLLLVLVAADGKQDALLRNLESGAARRKRNSYVNNKNCFAYVMESKETLN